jgi:hypothetical protein
MVAFAWNVEQFHDPELGSLAEPIGFPSTGPPPAP